MKISWPNKHAARSGFTWVFLTIAILLYDVYLSANGIPGDTWSEAMILFVQSHFFPAFFAGFMMGHLFIKSDKPRPKWFKWLLLPLLGVGLLVLDLGLANAGARYPAWFLGSVVSISPWIGALVWPQSVEKIQGDT